MHIILEGPDGAGKTTLARHLAQAGYAYRHEGPPPPRPRVSALRHYASVLASLTAPTLLDRFHLGELVYGPLVRGRSDLSPYGLKLLWRVFNGLGVRVVLCLPPLSVALQNWQRRRVTGHEFLTDGRTFKASYGSFMRLRSEAHDVHDYTESPPNVALARFTQLLPRCAPGVIGHPRAAVLFVGEKSNEPFDFPFLAEGGCSIYLDQALVAAGFMEREIAFTNAFSRDGFPVDLAARVRPGQTVVALGRQAERELTRARITDFISLPHPQYCKRFHASQPDYLTRHLVEVRRTVCRRVAS